jgi:hypothetical protein
MNYSVLLPRSVDFDPFAWVLYPSYPDETERPLVLDLIQMLWDRMSRTATRIASPTIRCRTRRPIRC